MDLFNIFDEENTLNELIINGKFQNTDFDAHLHNDGKALSLPFPMVAYITHHIILTKRKAMRFSIIF